MTTTAVVFGSESDYGEAQSVAQMLVAGDVTAEVHYAPEYDEAIVGRPDFVIALWSADRSSWPSLLDATSEALRSRRLLHFVVSPEAFSFSKLPVEQGGYYSLAALKPPLSAEKLRRMLTLAEPERDETPLLFAFGAMSAQSLGFVSGSGNLRRTEPRFDEIGTKSTSAKTESPRSLNAQMDEMLSLLKPAALQREAEAKAAAERDSLTANAAHAGAAGTLTQFNAIVAGLSGAFASQTATAAGRIGLIASVIAHTLAAFVLCFALRPVSQDRINQHRLLGDTVYFYRLGWRATLMSLMLTFAALVLVSGGLFGLF